MGIMVLKKEDGFWLSFESSTGKSALVPITKLMPLPGIATRAVLSTCEECASKSEVAAHSTSDNKSSPKLHLLDEALERLGKCQFNIGESNAAYVGNAEHLINDYIVQLRAR